MNHPFTLMSLMPGYVQDKYSHVIMLSIALVVIFCIGLLTRRMSKEIPTKGQVFFESLVGYVYNLGESVMGPKGVIYMPFILGIGFYVAISNLLGLIPGFIPPTMNMNTTAAPAVCVFLFYHYIGIKTHGAHYIKSFMGPMLVLAPLMFFIEVIGHLARPLSLTMRLFGNVTGEEIVLMILFMLVPFLVPLPMYFLIGFTGLLQAFVFMLLSMVYIGGALEGAH